MNSHISHVKYKIFQNAYTLIGGVIYFLKILLRRLRVMEFNTRNVQDFEEYINFVQRIMYSRL